MLSERGCARKIKSLCLPGDHRETFIPFLIALFLFCFMSMTCFHNLKKAVRIYLSCLGRWRSKGKNKTALSRPLAAGMGWRGPTWETFQENRRDRTPTNKGRRAKREPSQPGVRRGQQSCRRVKMRLGSHLSLCSGAWTLS